MFFNRSPEMGFAAVEPEMRIRDCGKNLTVFARLGRGKLGFNLDEVNIQVQNEWKLFLEVRSAYYLAVKLIL